ncbi:hypothetical protein DRO69_14475 [Candidatus Bathyarchaeota archaeon]|nr:MAG: hypothetical protein DRO69_14475 [Candidatus Bathyarchaeota archaeon]
MKLLVLGFDALEYNLVEKYRLNALKQKQYGKLFIPKECYTKTVDFFGNKVYEPWTPYVWSAFLTGKTPKELGLKKENVVERSNRVINFVRKLVIKMHLEPMWMKYRKLFGWAVKKFGGKRERLILDKEQTFLKDVDNLAINFPMLSSEWILDLPTSNLNEVVKKYWEQYFEIKAKTLQAIKNNQHTVILSYTRLLDIIGELCYGDKLEMMKAYFEINDFVKQIHEILPRNAICLIVSDHGIEPFNQKFGKHSDHAFWSLNIKTEWKPSSVTDFYAKLEKLLKGESS